MSGIITFGPLKRVGAFLVLALMVIALLGLPVFNPATACAQEGKAAVVVKEPDGDEKSACVDIGSGESSGIDALRKTEFDVVTKDFGADLGLSVCKIGETGTDDCDFSKGFWAYFRGETGSWVFSQVGAGSTKVSADGVEGWVWVLPGGDPNATPAPPGTQPSFDEICKVSSATPVQRDEEGSSALPWIIGGAALVIVAGVILLLRARSPA